MLQNRPDRNPEQLQRTGELMDAHVRKCLVTGFEDLIRAVKLPDEKDRHVLAVAIYAGADAFVTFDQKHFPPESVAEDSGADSNSSGGAATGKIAVD